MIAKKQQQIDSYIARWYPAVNCCVFPLASMLCGQHYWPSAFGLWYHSRCRDSPIWRSSKCASSFVDPILTRYGSAPSRSSRRCSLLSLARTWNDRSRCVHWMWLRFCCQLFVKVECSADSLCKIRKNISTISKWHVTTIGKKSIYMSFSKVLEPSPAMGNKSGMSKWPRFSSCWIFSSPQVCHWKGKPLSDVRRLFHACLDPEFHTSDNNRRDVDVVERVSASFRWLSPALSWLARRDPKHFWIRLLWSGRRLQRAFAGQYRHSHRRLASFWWNLPVSSCVRTWHSVNVDQCWA